jgi:hypothetical protein
MTTKDDKSDIVKAREEFGEMGLTRDSGRRRWPTREKLCAAGQLEKGAGVYRLNEHE